MKIPRAPLALLACVWLSLLGASPSAGQGREKPAGLVLSPSNVETVASPGLRLGPFGLSNQTSTSYRVRIFPVLLAQGREGGVIVRDDARALRRSRRVLGPDIDAFALPPGERQAASGIVKAVPRSGSFFGGLLFEARPRERDLRREQQIVEVLRLNAGVLLNPPAGERRVALEAGEIRAEQAGERRIRLLVPASNRGNAYLPARGTVRVLDAEGALRAVARLRSSKLLPGATVDLAALIDERLPPGTYRLEATVTMGGESVRARGEMALGGFGQVEFRSAELVDLPSPTAYEGDPIEVEATYRNNGNVAFAPEVELRVRPLVEGGMRKVAATKTLEAEETEPDETGDISGSIELPGEAEAYELELRLLDGDRLLDSRSVSATPQPRPALSARIGNWITSNAVALVLALTALALALAIVALRHIRKLHAITAARAESSPDAAAEPERLADVVRVPPVEREIPRERVDARVGEAEEPEPAVEEPELEERKPVAPSDGAISLSTAAFEDLRALGMSVTQAKRVLRYRDERNGFASLDELDQVPGFPKQFRAELERKLTV